MIDNFNNGPAPASAQLEEWSGAALPAVPNPALDGYATWSSTITSNFAWATPRWLNDNGDMIVAQTGGRIGAVGYQFTPPEYDYWSAATPNSAPVSIQAGLASGATLLPYAINNSDTVVGDYQLGSNRTAFIWTPAGGMADLYTLVNNATAVTPADPAVTTTPPAITGLCYATGLSNTGTILAIGSVAGSTCASPTQPSHAYLLVPSSGPYVDAINPPTGPTTGPMTGGTVVHVSGGNFVGPAGSTDTVMFCPQFATPTATPTSTNPGCSAPIPVTPTDDNDLTVTTPAMSTIFNEAARPATGLTSSSMVTDVIVAVTTSGVAAFSARQNDYFTFATVGVTSVMPAAARSPAVSSSP